LGAAGRTKAIARLPRASALLASEAARPLYCGQALTTLPGDAKDVPPVDAEMLRSSRQNPVASWADLHFRGLLHHPKTSAKIAITNPI